MFKKEYGLWLSVIFTLLPVILFAQNSITFNRYHEKDEVQSILNELQNLKPDKVKLHQVAISPGGNPVTIIEIGKDKNDAPAIFAGANFEGNIPLATEGAIKLAKILIDSSDFRPDIKWYILPLPNPDASAGYFNKVRYNRRVNDFEINNDVDDALNEDGFEDLNGDGFITKMRLKSHEGDWLISEQDPRIMVKADTKNGERGRYKIYTEGIDNDGDGEYNEDEAGGINIGINFPHLFPESKKEAGIWPGQAPEVYGIMRFIYDHPEIIMAYNLGSSNFCLYPPKEERKGDTDLDKIKIPSRYARSIGVDPAETFTMDQVINFMQDKLPAGTELTPFSVANMLNLGAAVNPLKEDLLFYNKFSQEYKKYLTTRIAGIERLDPLPARDGSFELWAYYHLGIPSFSMNLFTVPKAEEKANNDNNILLLDSLKKMSPEQFINLDNNKITAFLEANNLTEQFNAENIIKKVKSGSITPEKFASIFEGFSAQNKILSESDKALLSWSDNEWKGKGFVPWNNYQHPELGEVEIGGFVPFIETTPRETQIDSILDIHLPWLLELTKYLPVISFGDEIITDLGSGVYKLDLYIQNEGYLSYPIAMGQRNNQPAPVIIIIEGDFELLEGLKRIPLNAIGGKQVKKMSWLLKTGKKVNISAKIESSVFEDKTKTINIGG